VYRLGVDFDGTLSKFAFPEIGEPVPGAFEWLKRFSELGAKMFLWTVRSDKPERLYLTEAVEFCMHHGIIFDGVNDNPEQRVWSRSPKIFANQYIDDSACGCPLIHPGNGDDPYVDWNKVGPIVEKKILAHVDKVML
jgi:hypothetical protein